MYVYSNTRYFSLKKNEAPVWGGGWQPSHYDNILAVYNCNVFFLF